MKKLKILLLVGNSNDVFIYNFATWIKKSMDCTIDVFSRSKGGLQDFDESCYDHVDYSSASYRGQNIKGYGALKAPFYQAKKLKEFLKDKHYDIIHCHYILPYMVVAYRAIRGHCDMMYSTFWGGELEKHQILYSKALYKSYLKKFLHVVDYDINAPAFNRKLTSHFPFMESKMKVGHLGAVAIDGLAELVSTNDRYACKAYYEMPQDKLVVQIGYSGKSIHQQIPIIQALIEHPELQSKIHILSPMTRGASKEYIDIVTEKLRKSGFSYTVLKDRFLSDKEMSILRYSTDIILQLSEFDGFSRSIVEAFCAKSIVIYGKWLNYEPYMQENGYKGIEVADINESIQQLKYTINHINEWKIILENNSKASLLKNLWSECIKDWVDCYRNR